MPTRRTRDSGEPSRETTQDLKRPTISASDVGVTLRISDETLKEIEQIQEENIKAAQEDQKFAWR